MIFEEIISTENSIDWLQADAYIPWVELLHFPIEAQVILTPFRERVLSYIYRTARGLAEGLLESAIVEATQEPDEDDSLHLHLALTVNMDWDGLDKLHDQILARVAEWSRDWSLEDQKDYGRWIFFSLTPSQL